MRHMRQQIDCTNTFRMIDANNQCWIKGVELDQPRPCVQAITRALPKTWIGTYSTELIKNTYIYISTNTLYYLPFPYFYRNLGSSQGSSNEKKNMALEKNKGTNIASSNAYLKQSRNGIAVAKRNEILERHPKDTFISFILSSCVSLFSKDR